MARAWFITRRSSGFGEAIAQAAHGLGDNVAETCRDTAKLEDLQKAEIFTVSLDINFPKQLIEAAVAEPVKKYRTIDTLVNNAGYILEGGIEEVSDEEARAHFDTNLFGQIAFCATNFAMTGISEALRAECEPLGITVTAVEPGYFRTYFLSGGNKVSPKNAIEDYAPIIKPYKDVFSMYNHHQAGDQAKGAHFIVEALTGTDHCSGGKVPVRLVIGSDAIAMIEGLLEKIKGLEAWKDLAATTDIAT